MQRMVRRILSGMCIAMAIVWVTDYAVFHYRVWQNRAPFGSVLVNEYYTIQEKNNRTEYVYKSTDQQTCVNALLPHAGFPVCWYVRRHSEKPVAI